MDYLIKQDGISWWRLNTTIEKSVEMRIGYIEGVLLGEKLSTPTLLCLYSCFSTWRFDSNAYTKFKDEQLGGKNGLFFFTTGVLKCKIYVTSEFICEKLQRNDGCSRRLITQRIPSNVARSFAKGFEDLCKRQVVFPAPVVRRSDNTIHWINLYPVDNASRFAISYPLDSDLSIV